MERVKQRPEFSKAISGWTWNYAKRNFWRVRPDLDLEDLVAEGMCKWCECLNRYPHISEQKRMAALYRTAFVRRIETLASNRRRKVGIPFSVLKSENSETDILDSVSTDGGIATTELQILKDQAPPYIRELIIQLVDSEIQPRVLVKSMPMMFRALCEYFGIQEGPIKVEETRNEFLCRLTGKDPEKTDMIKEVLCWLAGVKSAEV